jgi:hypothetical protein
MMKMPKIPGATHHVGKGSKQERLPHRSALTTLTKGDPLQRTMNNYSAATPEGQGAEGPSIMGSFPSYT